jgi:hypothetical protein
MRFQRVLAEDAVVVVAAAVMALILEVEAHPAVLVISQVF